MDELPYSVIFLTLNLLTKERHQFGCYCFFLRWSGHDVAPEIEFEVQIASADYSLDFAVEKWICGWDRAENDRVLSETSGTGGYSL